MKKQTAVEWLVEQFENHRATFFKLNDKEERVITLAGRDVIKEAKAMEKEQIMSAYWHGSFNWETQGSTKYYTETYGGDE
jgi:hypothetical protein